MRSFFIFFVVFFSFFAVACGGEKVTLPDDESKTDEVVDETTETETDEVSDKDANKTENEEETDEDLEEITYHEPKSLDECQDSVCSGVCVVEWNQMGKDVIFYLLNGDGTTDIYEECPMNIKLEIGSDNQCYTTVIETTGCNVAMGIDGRRELVSSMPISGLWTTGPTKFYYEFSETDEEIQGNKVFNYTRWINCVNSSGIDLCEKYGIEKIKIKGTDYGYEDEWVFLAVSQ